MNCLAEFLTNHSNVFKWHHVDVIFNKKLSWCWQTRATCCFMLTGSVPISYCFRDKQELQLKMHLRKDEVQWVLPAGWRQEGHPAPKKICFKPFFHGYLWMTTKMGGVQPAVPHGQPNLPTRNRMMENPAKLQDGVPVIMKVIELTPCREASGWDGRILLMFQTA